MIATKVYDDAVRSIYNAAGDPDRWPVALQTIADAMGDVGTVLLWSRDDGSIGTIVSPALEHTHAEYIANWGARDIRAQRVIERGYQLSTDAVTDRHVVDDDEVLTLPIYTDYLIPRGLGWFAATSVAPTPHVWVVISVQRRFDKPRFTDDELSLVSQLGRHVEQSLRLSIRLVEEDARSTGLTAILNAMKIGLFGLDSLGRITFSNPVADALIGNGLAVCNKRVVPEVRADQAAFERRLESILRDAVPPDPKPLIIGGLESRRLVLRMLPLGTSSTLLANAMLADTRALVLAVELDRGHPIDPTILRDLLGLTLNEARVASLVGIGLQPRTIADHLGITEETARTVLKRVFGKVGVSRQAELVALLARLTMRG